MAKIALTGSASGSGTFTLTAPTTDNSYTLTLPVMSSGTLVAASSNGYVGIGTLTPQSHLDLGSNTGGRSISWGGDYSHITAQYSSAKLLLTQGFRANLGAAGFVSTHPSAGIYRTGIALDVVSGTGIQFFSDTSSAIPVGTAYTPVERVRITPAGNLLVGVSGGASGQLNREISMYGDGGQYVGLVMQNDATGIGRKGGAIFISNNDLTIANFSNGLITFNNSSSEHGRFDTSGNFMLGTTDSSGAKFKIGLTTDTIGIRLDTTATSSARIVQFVYNTANEVGRIALTTSTTAYVTSSDYRLKEDVKLMENALETVARLRPVTYTWKIDGRPGQGFIAHELQAVVPDAVSGTKDEVDADGNPLYQGVDTSFLVATLAKAIQELKAELDTVKAELSALKGQ